MQRTYSGKYFEIDIHGNEIPFPFKMDVILDKRLNFTGTVWAEEFSGLSGKQLSVRGFINDEHISFVKKYPFVYEYDEEGKPFIDESRNGHEVIYDGYWNEPSQKWVGEWEVEGETQTKFFTNEIIETKVFVGKFEMSVQK